MAESLSVTVNASTNHISSSGYSYDANGNTVDDGHVATYSFDAENRVASFNTTSYAYDGDDLRVYKSGWRLYWRGGGVLPLEETDLTGVAKKDYVYFGGVRIAFVDLSNGNRYYYYSDPLRSARAVTNGSGSSLQWTADYFPWGAIQSNPVSSIDNRYRFTGQEYDPETAFGSGSGNSYFPSRYYSPTLARFLTTDPAGLAAVTMGAPHSWNRYTYALNNPSSLVDPLGLCVLYTDPQTGITACDVNVAADPNAGTGAPDTGGASGAGGGHPHAPLLDPNSPEGGGGFIHLFGIRAHGQTFTHCMSANASTYSIGGSAELVANVATGTNTNFSAYTSPVTGNAINTFLSGSGSEAAGTMAANAPGAVGEFIGSAVTYGRRTADIMSINIQGAGGLPSALTQASAGFQSALGRIGNALSLGMSFSTRIAVDAAFTAAEAINCSIER